MALDVSTHLLRALVVVLEAGSLTAASERLGFTQSALSKQIAALEAAAGTRLLARGPRGVQPTEAGRRLARRAAVVLDTLDAADRELATAGTPVEGRVTLGGFPTAAMRLVPETLARLAREHPAVVVDFSELSSALQVRRLRAGRLDVAVVAVGPGTDVDLVGLERTTLRSGPLLLAVHEDHAFAGRGSVPVAELVDQRWVTGRVVRGEPQFGVWPTVQHPTVVAELTEWTARLGFVAAGLAVTSIPSLALGALPPGVVTVEVDDPDRAGRELVVAHHPDIDEGARALRSALVETARRLS